MKWKMLKLLMVFVVLLLTLNIISSQSSEGTIEVWGTEYTPNQHGKVWLQLLNSTGFPVTYGVCFADIYSPNNTYVKENEQMINFNHEGIYYEDFFTSDLFDVYGEGVYPVIAKCYYSAIQSNNFATNYSIANGTYLSGVVSNTYTIESSIGGSLQFREEASGNPKRLNLNITFNNQSYCNNIPESLLTGITLQVNGRFDSTPNDNLNISVWNYSSSSWLTFPNQLLEGNVWRTVSNSISLTNITKSGLVNSSGGGIRIRFLDTPLADGTTDTFELDYINFKCDQLAFQSFVEIRGSSEIHISESMNVTDLAYQIFQYLIVNLTYSPELINYSLIPDTTNYSLISELINQSLVLAMVNYSIIEGLINYSMISEMINQSSSTVDYGLISQMINDSQNDNTNYTYINEILQNLFLEFGFIEELPSNISYLGLSYLSYTYDSINSTITFESYPYVDINRNYTIDLYIPTGTQLYPVLSINNSIYNFTFLGSDNYEIIISFDTVGDYPFQINESSTNLYSGTFLARDCYNITLNIYQSKTGRLYKNNFAYILAESTSRQTQQIGEQFLIPLGYSYMFKSNVFHTEFENGKGTLELCEKNTPMILRLVDGELIFTSDYSPVNVSKSYGTNIYLGTFTFSGTDETLNIYLDDSEIYPYRWLFNWGFVIIIIFIIIISIALFVYFPMIPFLSVSFGLGSTIMLIILRGVIWLSFGY